jgi:hypothetical protein
MPKVKPFFFIILLMLSGISTNIASQTLEDQMRAIQEQQRRAAEQYQKQKQQSDRERAERQARIDGDNEAKRKSVLTRTTAVYQCGTRKPPFTLRFTEGRMQNVTGLHESLWHEPELMAYTYDKSKGTISFRLGGDPKELNIKTNTYVSQYGSVDRPQFSKENCRLVYGKPNF